MQLQAARDDAAKLFEPGGPAYARETTDLGRVLSIKFAREMRAGCWDHRREVVNRLGQE